MENIVEEIKIAYKKLQMKPCSREWYKEVEGVRYCCPLAALALVPYAENPLFLKNLNALKISSLVKDGFLLSSRREFWWSILEGIDKKLSIESAAYRLGEEIRKELEL